jgi:predicted secreted acid phosphatase
MRKGGLMKRLHRYLIAVALVLALGIQAYAQETKPAAGASVKPKACVIDLDGTVADETARREKAEKECPKDKDKSGYYKLYFDPALIAKDTPIDKSREVLKWVEAQGIDIYYVSSRNQSCVEASIKWLEDNGFPKGKQVCHQKSPQKSVPYKTKTIKRIQEKADVLFGVGDSDTDVEAYNNCGIKAIQVKANSSDDWDRVKTEIEKVVADKK